MCRPNGRRAEILHSPRIWPEYHSGYYGTFVRDSLGNNIEAVDHNFDGWHRTWAPSKLSTLAVIRRCIELTVGESTLHVTLDTLSVGLYGYLNLHMKVQIAVAAQETNGEVP